MVSTYKAIATITWKFDSLEGDKQALEQVKKQLDNILDSNPQGSDFENFTVQVDLARMKERKRLIHLGEFELDDVLPFVTTDEVRRDYMVDGIVYSVRMNSDRYFVFKNNPSCVSCGLIGNKMVLDLNPGDQSPHFNLYAEENGRLILMTKDHIVAKSNGGKDEIENYQSMCSVCNNLKGAHNLQIEDVRELRTLYDNQQMLPRKELRELINKRREELEQKER